MTRCHDTYDETECNAVSHNEKSGDQMYSVVIQYFRMWSTEAQFPLLELTIMQSNIQWYYVMNTMWVNVMGNGTSYIVIARLFDRSIEPLHHRYELCVTSLINPLRMNDGLGSSWAYEWRTCSILALWVANFINLLFMCDDIVVAVNLITTVWSSERVLWKCGMARIILSCQCCQSCHVV